MEGSHGMFRRHVAAASAVVMVALYATLMVAAPADAAPHSGGFSPTIVSGLADLNGDGIVDGSDDSNAFYGDTSIIDGALDCNAWVGTNAGTAGDLVILANDDCTLIGYNGTPSGVTINVVDGVFQVSDGPLPHTFNDTQPANNDVGDSDFGWSTINGRVDTNGDEQINANDCHFGLIGETVDAGMGAPADGADVVANTAGGTDPCGFGSPSFTSADNGKVDLNSDKAITTADSCTGCFFGLDLVDGVVDDGGAAAPAPAGGHNGGLAPTIISGRADMNGDGIVDGSDDSNAFYGDTHIIDGQLDCNAWGSTRNAGFAGSGVIDGADDCTMIGFDGTSDGVEIDVVDGEFQFPDGQLPFVFPNPATPNDPDIGNSRFAWSAINGRVDANGDETIDQDDCHFGVIGELPDVGLGDPTDGADILGNDAAGTNPCGHAVPPFASDSGKVDLNDDGRITTADSCAACFLGHDVQDGLVQPLAPPAAAECPGFAGDPRNHVVGTSAGETLNGTAGDDIICAGAGDDTVNGGGGNDLILGEAGNDTLNGEAGNDTVNGGDGDDNVNGGDGDDTLTGDAGNDTMSGDAGNDTMSGGDGNDSMSGGAGNDSMSGGAGNDRMSGGSGNDRLSGGSGKDKLSGNSGNDKLSGGSGKDKLNGGSGNDRCNGGGGKDKLRRCEKGKS